MKKLIAILLVLCMAVAMTACGKTIKKETKTETIKPETEPSIELPIEDATEPPVETVEVMTHAEYMAAEEFAPVCIEAYVQATQSWWDDKITVYAQDEDGAYFIYNLTCTEEQATELVPGAKIKVTGYKAYFAGLGEIAAGATFEFVDGEEFMAEALDVTELMGTEELAAHQGEKVSFKGVTIVAKTGADGEEAAYLYGWDGSGEPGSDSDLYFDGQIGDKTYTFVIEYYLCDSNSAAYQAVQNLKVGDVVDMEGFLYWYEGPQAHITAVIAAE